MIRTSVPEDRPAVLDVVRSAFGRDDEADLARRIWDAPEYLPDLDLVALVDGEIVGHAMHSIGYLEARTALALAPLSVRADHQGKGVGTSLMKESIARAEASGYPMIILLGHPDYYSRFGFRPASRLGIRTEIELRPGPDPFLALPLANYDTTLRGLFRYFWESPR